jgi:Lon protease-like protein
MAESLPLFPLGTVLLPGGVLPLHVFEPRYRQLVKDLLELPEGSARGFGVVAVAAGSEVGPGAATALAGVGCLAQVRAVSPHGDGRFDLVAVGTRRFRLLGLDDAAGKPYLVGRVDWLAEPLDAPGAEGSAGESGRRLVALVGAVSARFRRYLEMVTGGDAGAEVLPGEPAALSYLVAGQMVLDRTDRQQLLEAPDTTARLRLELRLLHREEVLVGALGALPGTDALAQR